jgi:hypothetical protein
MRAIHDDIAAEDEDDEDENEEGSGVPPPPAKKTKIELPDETDELDQNEGDDDGIDFPDDVGDSLGDDDDDDTNLFGNVDDDFSHLSDDMSHSRGMAIVTFPLFIIVNYKKEFIGVRILSSIPSLFLLIWKWDLILLTYGNKITLKCIYINLFITITLGPHEVSSPMKQRPTQVGPRSIKFTVRTKGQNDEKPIELEIEIKDQVSACLPRFSFVLNILTCLPENRIKFLLKCYILNKNHKFSFRVTCSVMPRTDYKTTLRQSLISCRTALSLTPSCPSRGNPANPRRMTKRTATLGRSTSPIHKVNDTMFPFDGVSKAVMQFCLKYFFRSVFI